MKMLSGEWFGPWKASSTPLAADVQGVGVGEGHLGRGPGRVVVPQQEPAGFLVADADDVVAKQAGRSGVVGAVVGVDQMGHAVGHPFRGGDLVHGSAKVVADGGWGVEQRDSVVSGEECRQ